MKNKKIIIFIIFLVVVVVLIFGFQIKEKYSGTIVKKEKEKIDEVIDVYFNEDVTKEELEKLTGIEDVKSMIVVGQDSDLNDKPSSKQISSNNLSEYVTAHQTYVKEIETMFKNNFKYEITNEEKWKNDDTVYEIAITGFYYSALTTDMTEFAIKLLEKAGYSFKNYETDVNTQVAFYKAKVKALELISPFIKDYENYDETVSVQIIYNNGKVKDESQMTTLLGTIMGLSYKNMDFIETKNLDAMKQRVETYYQTAINNGTLDEANPLKLSNS